MNKASGQTQGQTKPNPLQASGILQRKCACGNHTGAPGECSECAKKERSLQRKTSNHAKPNGDTSLSVAPAIQRKLTIGASDDPLEQEADRVANQVMVKPTHSVPSNAPLRIQRYSGQTTRGTNTSSASVDRVLASSGRPLEPALRQDMEQRFGHDFSQVRVHSDTAAAQSAREVNANGYTVGNNVVFGAGKFLLGTHDGRRLIAHELTHVIQQSDNGNKNSNNLIQRQNAGARRERPSASQRMEFRPSIRGAPCACIVFIHNNERNAREAAEYLHQSCAYNLAIIGPGGRRLVPRRGTNGTVDPNELFPLEIQERCTIDEAECIQYEESHNDIEAMQIQFFLTIKSCSNNFQLPAIALHNNSLGDTRSFLRRSSDAQRETSRGDFNRSITSQQDLRSRLGQRGRGIMDASRTTNIFRWCHLPEIGRCHVGDPHRPDHVIWVNAIEDFNALREARVNVVLQDTSGPESENDLSTLFLRLGPTARFINIETPIAPRDRATRERDLDFIQEILGRLNLNCCRPIGDFPTTDRTDAIA